MPNYRLTPDAKSDLIEIRHYTLQHWGAHQSKKYLSELRKTIRLVSEAPSCGKPRPEVGANVLSFPHASHIIYYIVNEQQVVVFGVLHKRMAPDNHLAEREAL